MKPATTLNELADRVLGNKTVEALQQIDFQKVETTSETGTLDINDLAKRYLVPETNDAFSNIDLKKETFGFHLEVKEFQASIRMRGLSTIIALLFLASLVLEGEHLIQLYQMLQHLISGL